ncbi:hypothetical protein BaRGS_00027403, partial [Batillaria attramentaria]
GWPVAGVAAGHVMEDLRKRLEFDNPSVQDQEAQHALDNVRTPSDGDWPPE